MCAVIQRGILGGFSNKIGNVVGTSWKGIAVMKSLPLSVANPRTTAQVNQRGKFKTASIVGSTLLSSIVKPLWDRFAQRESGFNAFIQSNMIAFDSNGVVNPEFLQISKGRMSAVTPATAVRDTSTGVMTVTWDTTLPDAYSADTDEVYIVVGVKLDQLVAGFGAVAARVDGTATFTTYPGVDGTVWYACLAFRRVDGTYVSDTGYKVVTVTP